jgi:hypothetical protein
MILSSLRTAIPYKCYWLLSAVLIGILHPVILPQLMDVELLPGALIPDAALMGYNPSEVLAWYEALGASGRRMYVYVALFDVVCIIPSYLVLLSCQLLYSPHCPETLAYLPSAMAIFDLLETGTHMYYAVYYPVQMPTTRTLVVVSCATQFKYLVLVLSLLLVAYYAALDYYYPSRSTTTPEGPKVPVRRSIKTKES